MGQIVNVLGALLLVKVITGTLTPEQYGHVTLALTAVTLIHQIIMGGTLNSIGRYYPIAVDTGETNSFLYASKFLIFLNVAIVLVAALPAVYLICQTGNQYVAATISAVAALSIVNGFNGAVSSIQNAARRRGIVAFHLALDSWLKIALVLLVVWILGDSSVSVLAAYVVTATIVLVSQIILFNRYKPPPGGGKRNVADWIRKMSRYSWPFVAWGGFTWAQFASDRWFLQAFSGSTDVGLYSVVYQLGFVPIGIATNIAANFIGPILYQHSGDARNEQRNRSVHNISWSMTYLCLIFTGTATVIAWFLHNWIFGFIVAPNYRSVSYLLPYLILAGGMFAAGELLALKLMAELKVSSMIPTKILTSLLGLLLNMLGAMSFGIIGVVLAQILYSGLYLLSMVFLSKRRSATLNSSNSREAG